jgi:hypothetical protein
MDITTDWDDRQRKGGSEEGNNGRVIGASTWRTLGSARRIAVAFGSI